MAVDHQFGASETSGPSRGWRPLLGILAASGLLISIATAGALLVAKLSPEEQAIVAEGEAFLSHVIAWGMGFAFTIYAFANFDAAWRLARQRKFTQAALGLAMGIVQLLLALSFGLSQ